MRKKTSISKQELEVKTYICPICQKEFHTDTGFYLGKEPVCSWKCLYKYIQKDWKRKQKLIEENKKLEQLSDGTIIEKKKRGRKKKNAR